MITRSLRKYKVYVATGYTDLRRGIDGLASIVHDNFKADPTQEKTVFLFCGRRNDRYKGVMWEGDSFMMFYKRFEVGKLSCTPEQYDSLMDGIEIIARKPIKKLKSPKFKS